MKGHLAACEDVHNCFLGGGLKSGRYQETWVLDKKPIQRGCMGFSWDQSGGSPQKSGCETETMIRRF
jgi:hypothetical protein